MSDTTRTDKKSEIIYATGYDRTALKEDKPYLEVVPLEFARMLERELAAASLDASIWRVNYEAMNKQVHANDVYMEAQEVELVGLRAENERLKAIVPPKLEDWLRVMGGPAAPHGDRDVAMLNAATEELRAENERLTKQLRQCEADLRAPADWREKIPAELKRWQQMESDLARVSASAAAMREALAPVSAAVSDFESSVPQTPEWLDGKRNKVSITIDEGRKAIAALSSNAGRDYVPRDVLEGVEKLIVEAERLDRACGAYGTADILSKALAAITAERETTLTAKP